MKSILFKVTLHLFTVFLLVITTKANAQENTAPSFTSTPPTANVNVGDDYSYTANTEGDVVSITSADKPSWLTLTTGHPVTTFSGSGQRGFADGTGAAAKFSNPTGVAVDSEGNVYVADKGNQKIRKITPAGVVSTFAGNSISGDANGAGTTAKFNQPFGIAIDSQGNVYVADIGNHKIQQLTTASDGTVMVSTLAGSEAGFRDGIGTAAKFYFPIGVAVDNAGNVYVGDKYNQKIRKITPARVVSTFAGSGQQGFADGTGAAAQFNNPNGVAVDSEGNVYVADEGNHKIRKITPAGVVSTFAGSGQRGFADGTGTAAQFNRPYDVAVDSEGNVYVADLFNHKIRKITPARVVSTFAGSGQLGSADGTGPAAKFKYPNGVAVDSEGNVYVADEGNHKIRKISSSLVGSFTGDTTGHLGTHTFTVTLTGADGSETTQQVIIKVVDPAQVEAALVEVKEDIAGNTNEVNVTAEQLNLLNHVFGAIADVNYTDALQAASYANRTNPTSAEIQAVIDAVNTEVAAALAEVVEDIKGNANETKVTAAQLNSIGGVSGAVDGVDYTTTLDNATYADEDNPTAAEIQAVVNAVNAEVAALAEVVEDIKGNANETKVTAAQLNSITGVSGAQDGVDYTTTLDNATYADEDNPTAAEIQAVVNAVNAEVAALAEVVEDIKGNANETKVTAAQLNSITGVSGAQDGVDYTTTLDKGTYADEDNPTAAEIQAVVNAVNAEVAALAEVVEDIKGNANETKVTAAQLNSITGVSEAQDGVDYTTALDNATYADEDNPTAAEIQAVVNAVNAEVAALAEVVEDIKGNANETKVTAAQLNSITGVSGAQDGVDYTTTLDNGTYADEDNPTAAEIQAVVNAVNTKVAALAEVVEDIKGNANETKVTAAQLNIIVGVSGAIDGVDYTTALNNGIYADEENPTAVEIQTVVNVVNAEVAALAEVVEDIKGNANETKVTASQLNRITGVSGAQDGVDYTTALDNATYTDEDNPTAAEIQAVVNAVNAEVAAALAEVVEDIKGNVNGIEVTAAQLNSISGVSGAQDGVNYTTALDNATYADEENPTTDEIQAVVNVVNAKVAALAEVVEDIAGNTNSVGVTAAQLNSIDNVIGAIDGVDYTRALKNGRYADPSNPTAAEIQTVINDVNSHLRAKKYGFSPNGDGINDTWTIDYITQYPNNTVKVFNRSGKLVFEQNGYNNTWDGISNRSTSEKRLPVGAYLFVIDLKSGEKLIKGWLYINY